MRAHHAEADEDRLDLAGEQIVERGAGAAVVHRREAHAGGLAEELAGEMRDRPRSGRAVVQLARLAPRGTPQPMIALLNREIHAALDDATVRERLQEGGLEPLKETPAQFTERMKRDHERYREIVKAAGLKPE